MEIERTDLKKMLKAENISRFDRSNIEEMRKEINRQLAILEKTYGVSIQVGRIRFSDVSFKANLEATLLHPESTAGDSAEEIEFKRACFRVGLKPEHYNQKVKLHGKFAGLKGRITKINTRAKKYPVVIQLDDGRMVKMTAFGVLQQLN